MKLTPEQKAFYEYGKAVKDLSNIIKEIRHRRAQCRAWVNIYKRNCENCKYFSRNETEEPCVKCSGLYEGLPEYWEPRKDEEDETDS
jgi:hypothetical protein